MATPIELPERIMLGVQRLATEEAPNPLAYLAPVKSAPSANAKSFESLSKWARLGGEGKESARFKEIDNRFVKGVKISKVVSRYSTSNKLFTINDPRGFSLQIYMDNMQEILENCTIVKGVIQESCAWTRYGGNTYLIAQGTPSHTTALEVLANPVKVKKVNTKPNIKELSPGELFTRNYQTYLYLGKADISVHALLHPERVMGEELIPSLNTLGEVNDQLTDLIRSIDHNRSWRRLRTAEMYSPRSIAGFITQLAHSILGTELSPPISSKGCHLYLSLGYKNSRPVTTRARYPVEGETCLDFVKNFVNLDHYRHYGGREGVSEGLNYLHSLINGVYDSSLSVEAPLNQTAVHVSRPGVWVNDPQGRLGMFRISPANTNVYYREVFASKSLSLHPLNANIGEEAVQQIRGSLASTLLPVYTSGSFRGHIKTISELRFDSLIRSNYGELGFEDSRSAGCNSKIITVDQINWKN